MVALDLYINCTQEVTLTVKDASKGQSLSLSGYFEPKGDEMDDDMFGYGREEDDEGEDLEDDDDDESDDEKTTAGADKKGLVVKGKAITPSKDA